MFKLCKLEIKFRNELLKLKTNIYKLREDREISPKAFAHLVSSTLYEKRFGPYFAEPIIAGIKENGEAFICSMDLIGCINFAKDFVVIGTASDKLYGICEALYEPNLVYIIHVSKFIIICRIQRNYLK